ncbi:MULTISPECIES: GntR family transcriptional regulator [Streptomyces]|jgi:DNA-binding GntR family transcriptional regulator|uniref:GntR family transcriptional regulator n=2 Tax=Streptomyces TaxID=1883 RepID=A0A514JS01_9ACTN|nr:MULTISPECIES: GntR family transcriptional regulator [Streptomyces]MBA8947106.1 DNA-binding GntR family transcriptional regulator [Streptomyces calvus]MBA8977075.1 DNA-binding GntR family transcriptional regulator [Streptomyces calvus]MYS28561.1 GntR family transcriptional regulator [Streptomyces sp. SID7804]QDI70105.1 GntR family transcriptional regulator [Streptomyces calvus]GGP38639.1 GntR family transcriptional regulator [Streptomyces calvus]
MPGFSGSGAVTRSTLRQQIADALRDEVLAGRLQSGQEFTVKEIAEQYGVSATPVREALVDLSAQGLLDADQHRGFRVHEYSAEDFRDMVEARSLVTSGIFRALAEGHGTHAAVPPGPPRSLPPDESRVAAVLAGVRRRGEEAQRAAVAGDVTVLIGYDLRFWRELGALFGNPYLTDFLNRLRVQTWVCVVQHLRRLPDLRGRLWAGHTDLVDALVRRDTDAAHAMVESYNAHALRLIESLTDGGMGKGPARGEPPVPGADTLP